jgi:dipeptidyl aminopeptidase/acylaminoacyl peptidase
MFRFVLLAAIGVASLVAATSGGARSTTISPCRQVTAPTWSPDGLQIAFYGRRWPPPSTPHRNPNSILQAFCVMDADGTNAQPLRYTVCSENCPDLPNQLEWLAPNELLALRDGDILRFAPGSKPARIARINDFSFALDPTGTRLAAGTPDCPQCSGPLTILRLPSGAVVAHVGGKKLDNVTPSLSPDGSRVVFGRHRSDDSGRTLGLWTANVDGSRLRQLTKVGEHPLWSPTGGKIAYVGFVGRTVALSLVSAGRGRSRTLIPGRVQNVFGWSPDGRSIAFETGTGTFGKLAVVDVATGKVRRLLQLYYAPFAVWKPDSSELLAYSLAKSQKCWSLTRVPVDGSTPTVISSCNS